MRIKRIVIIVELCILLALAALTAVFGFKKGVWDGSRFIAERQDGSKKAYAGSVSSVEIAGDGAQGIVYFSSEDGGRAQLSYEVFGGDSLKTVRLLSEGGVTILSDTYSASEGKWSSTYERDHMIGDHVREQGQFSLGISDQAILDMVSGNSQSKLSGHTKGFLLGLLFAALGFAFNFVTGAIVKLDKFLLGIFYDNAKNLRISEVGKDLLIVPGIILFAVGVIFCTCVLFA